ncbi:TATA box-binding protein-associated factor RNA polymerase I subunit B [Morella rubra]|uniref:TATA box-binding protein-associated factor RNA polymerase I subunit B n=1 Tax=Morella rubra TaxID=262757 RepID=A0A6A1V7F8_9ROSI|nr:TATA box-binding protein-associated factor RNA polymerase I subunit B [Morella rubra]
MSDPQRWTCNACGNVGLADGSDGFFYCVRCGARADDIIETGVADEDYIDKGGDAGGAIYLASYSRRRNRTAIKAEPISQSQSLYDATNSLSFWNILTQEAGAGEATPQPQSTVKKEEYFDDGVGPSGPEDFGNSSMKGYGPSFEDYYNEIRIRYVMGLQLMVQLQCEALVREFKVTPLICGLAGSLWMRFVATTGVFDDDWADHAIQDSEMQSPEEPEDPKPRAKYSSEPHNMYGQRAVIIWYKSLRKRIPLSCSFAVSFLACHIAREAILPTDIVKWSLEGKLPYFAAFEDIEKRIGRPSSACPISSNVMFRPSQALPFQKLESLAASIAQSIGLNLPPVNFYAIAFRYLQKLCLPIDNILPHACRIYEWSTPPDSWLSSNELKLPTRVCVMSILIVAIRILYNIHGFGEWEKSLSSNGGSFPMSNQIGQSDPMVDSKMGYDAGKASVSSYHDVDGLHTTPMRNSSKLRMSGLDAAELLHKLEARYNEIADSYEYSKDLATYLQYCKDVVFAGLEPSFENHEEEKLIEEFWEFYQNQKVVRKALLSYQGVSAKQFCSTWHFVHILCGCFSRLGILAKDSEPAEDFEEGPSNAFNQKRMRDAERASQMPEDNKEIKDEGCVNGASSEDVFYHANDPEHSDGTYHADDSLWGLDGGRFSQSSKSDKNTEYSGQDSAETLKNEAIRRMKLDMEENRFCYIPPRVNVKRLDYLHYVRKKDGGAFTYAAHADYYILLRVCAKVAQVDIRIMHIGVLGLERRLAWLENRIDHCLHLTPPNVSCEFCSDVGGAEHAGDDSIGFSNLNI